MILELAYIKCPHCGEWYSHTDVVSYSNFGQSTCWSDGKCEGGDMDELSMLPFSKCDKCGNFFWLEDCQKLREFEIFDYKENRPIEEEKAQLIKSFFEKYPNFNRNSDDVSSLNYPPPDYWFDLPNIFLKDLQFILKNDENLDNERKVYLRTKIWHNINDLKRKRKSFYKFEDYLNFKRIFLMTKNKFTQNNSYHKYKTIKKDNLLKLFELLFDKKYKDYPDVKMQKIEITRELGMFAETQNLINSLNKDDLKEYFHFVEKTKKMIKIKSKKLFRIS